MHILDHLDEIDRRGLALRRGFSSLFDYAVRELGFTDAAAQRRIQTMRLSRRHGWVRGKLQSGKLNLTSAAQLEIAFAGAERAERAERQSRTGRRNVGQGRCHDQDQDQDSAGPTRQLGLPTAPGEAGEQGERGPRSAPELAPPAGQCCGDAAAVNAPVVPVASHAVAQDPGAGHAGALPPPPGLNGSASPFPAPPSTRQVAGLLAAAAPEVVPPRDTLRAVAPDRYTLKVTIDQECEQGLRLLKGLLSHHDPRMSWGDLVARLVREAVARHDPRGGGSGHRRRQSAGSAGASPRRAPKKTRAAGAPAGPAQGVSESSGRAPNLTRPAGAPAQRGGGDTPATQGDTAATGRQNPIAMAANAAAASQSAPAALSDGARAGSVPSGTPAAAAAPQFAGDASADGANAGTRVPVSPVATSAPAPALGVFSDGGPPGASAEAVAHTTRDSVHRRHQSPPRRPIPAAVRRHIWQRDEGRCCYRDPLTGRRCTSSHLLQIDHLLPVAQGGGPEPFNLQL